VTRTLGGVRGALRQFLAEPSTRLEEDLIVDFVIVYYFQIFSFLENKKTK
jgi:hypothetical protein